MRACSAPVLVASSGTPIFKTLFSSTRSTVAKSTNMLDNVEGNVRLEMVVVVVAAACACSTRVLPVVSTAEHGGHGIDAGCNAG